jgi:cysteine desulfurase / selenocysteine lyase
MFNRSDFPFFSRHKNAVYLDSAATSLKPQEVIDALANGYSDTAPVHRGIYNRAEKITASYEAVRDSVADLIKAKNRSEIVFTKNATEAANIAALSLWEELLQEGDEIVTTQLEHHSHLLPLQCLAERKNLRLTTIPVDSRGVLKTNNLSSIITSRTKLVAMTLDSNVIAGGIDPLPIIQLAQQVGAYISLDATQAVAHSSISVEQLQPDVFFFSAHKMLGPEGVGVLYIKQSLHAHIRPTIVGGGMVSRTVEKPAWRPMPYLLEAGTPSTAAVIALGSALEYRKRFSFDALQNYERQLCSYLWDELSGIPEITLYGKDPRECSITHLVTFTVEGIHPHDVAAFLDTKDIEVRAGNHCAESLHDALGILGTVRVSVYGYNTLSDMQCLVAALKELIALSFSAENI